MPLCTRISEAIRRSFAAYCPTLRRTFGSSFGPMTTTATINRTTSSPKLNPNTG